MPGESLCQGAKELLLETGGGISGNILTPRKLSESLYDHLGIELPVIGLSGREILIKELMSKEFLPNLISKGDPSGRMVRYISREIGSLIQGEIDPGVLEGGRKGDLRKVYQGYLRILEERNLADPEQVPILVCKELEENGTAPWRKMAVYMLGDVPVCQENMIESLSKKMEQIIVIEHDCRTGNGKDLPIPPRDRKGRLVLRYDRKFALIRESTPFEEVDSIARFIKSRLVSTDLDPWQISVVLPARRKYDSLIRVLFDRYGLPLEMGRDMRLGSIQPVGLIIDLLESVREGYPREILLKSLSSRWIELPTAIRWKDLERITREIRLLGGGKNATGKWVDGLLQYSQDEGVKPIEQEMAGKWAQWLQQLLHILDNLGKGRKSARRRASLVLDLVRFLSIPERIRMAEKENINSLAFGSFIDCLRKVVRRSALLDLGETDLDEFLDLLELEITKEKVSTVPSGRGIRILGLEGAVGESFDLLIAGGLDSASLPSPESGFSILTEGDRIELGLQETARRRRQIEDLAMVLSSADEIVLSYHEEEEGRPVAPSPFISLLETEPVEIPGGLLSVTDLLKRTGELSDPSFKLYDRTDGSLEDIMYDRESLIGMMEDELSSRVRMGLKGRSMRCSPGRNPYKGAIMDDTKVDRLRSVFGPDHIWSPSRFETFRECPYRFFSRYVLGLVEREDLEPGVPPERKGLIFHSIAERFYQGWMESGKKRIRKENLQEARQMMRSVCLEVLDEHPYSGPYWDALKDLLLGSEGETGLLEEFLKVESEYSGLFEVDGTEVRFGPLAGNDGVILSLPGQEDGPDRFKLQGSIDRVDRVKNEKGDLFFIWDYKTGRADISEDSLQVPLYLAALRRLRPEALPGGGGYYYIRRKGSIRRDPLLGNSIWDLEEFDTGKSSSNLDELSGRISDDINTSLEIIDSIRCGDFSPEATCRSRSCPYNSICRRGEQP
jgi:ATP-dependent helicase/DNAse subunit B